MKIEIRTICKICNNKITENRYRTYCSAKCRTRKSTIKDREYRTEWQRKRRDEIAKIVSSNKIQCLVCKKYYVQVCSHIVQVHKMLAREYKENYGLDVKRGRLPTWYRKVKAESVFENGTVNNLKAGKKFWFRKESKTAGRYKRSDETIERLKVQGKIIGGKLRN